MNRPPVVVAVTKVVRLEPAPEVVAVAKVVKTFPLTGPSGPTSTAVAGAGAVPVFSTAAKHEG